MVFDAVRSLFGGSEENASVTQDRDGIYVYVKCGTCGAPVKVRADKRHDLMRDYESGGYVYRKEVMDGSCFQLFNFTIHFSNAYRVVDREITGGEFITRKEYRALREERTSTDEETTG
jgi:hypothetical protein